MKSEQITAVKMGINGEGIGYLNRMPVFCPELLPGETAEVELSQPKEHYLTARVRRRLNDSPDRVPAVCPRQKTCGGCPLMILRYPQQLIYKRRLLVEALYKYAHIPEALIRSMHASPLQLGYRSQCKLPVQMDGGHLCAGMYQPGSNHFVPVQHCPIHTQALETLRMHVLAAAESAGMTAFDSKTGRGLRSLVIRSLGSEAQCCLITGTDPLPPAAVEKIAAVAGITSLTRSINSRRNSESLFGTVPQLLAGKETITLHENGLTMQLSARSFFQMNEPQAALLYQMAIAKIDPCQRLVEAYCGIGAMSLMAAKKAKEVIGIESVREAVQNAQANARLNHLEQQVHFLCADAAQGLHQILAQKDVSTLLADPPRSGMDDAMIQEILASRIQRIIYISCNPATLGRNLAQLQAAYRPLTIIPFDLFPQTPQVESLTVLTRIRP